MMQGKPEPVAMEPKKDAIEVEKEQVNKCDVNMQDEELKMAESPPDS